MDLRRELEREIERLKEEIDRVAGPLVRDLKRYEATMAFFDGQVVPSRAPEERFVAMTPRRAIRIVLSEAGRGMAQEEITKILVDGGVTKGKKRDAKQPNNVRIAFERLLKNGSLKQVGNLIGLPDWGDDKFVPTPNE